MIKYAITYCRIPTNYNDKAVAVVEAESPDDALELLRHKLGDHSGVHNYVIGEPHEYVPPKSAGRIITLNDSRGDL
jgi:hypothetical protein